MGTIALVGKDQYNLKVTGTIDDRYKADGYMFVGRTYPMTLTITNISDITATTSILTIESDNPAVTVVSIGDDNLAATPVGSLAGGGTKILNLGVTCSDIDAAHIDAGIKVTIENVAADQIWVDYVPMRFYRQTVFFTVKALSPDNNDDAELKGFIIYPDGNSQYFSVGNNQYSTIEVPEFGDDEPYLMAFCGATPNSGLYSTEMYYTVICGQHPLDINLSESGTQLAEYILFGEPNNSQPTAHSVTSAFQAYLHAEDIDYYRVTAAMDKDLHLIHYIDTKNMLHSDNPIMFRENEDIVLKDVSLTGYTFNGWYDASTEGNKITGWAANTYTNDVTLYARWTANSYTITFNANGGTGTMDSQSMTYDDSAVLPLNEFTKDNYGFKGWALSADGEVVYNYGQTVKNLTVDNGAEIILYAIWIDTGILANGNMIISGEEYDKTSFVKVRGTEITITGTDDNWSGYLDSSAPGSYSYKGVFINGRTVKISPYYMAKYQVTQQFYEAVMSSGKNYNYGNGDTYPAYYVSWYDAITFCNKLSLLMGKTPCYTVSGITDWAGLAYSSIPTSNNSVWNEAACDITKNGYRLPTEAEWEFAARGGDPSNVAWKYAFSGIDVASGNKIYDGSSYLTTDANLATVGWYSSNSGLSTHPVGEKLPNRLGLYDMSGNILEWCQDRYNETVTSNDTAWTVDGVVTNPMGAASGSYRVHRGGNWRVNAYNCCVSLRCYFNPPCHRYSYIGFRPVCSAE